MNIKNLILIPVLILTLLGCSNANSAVMKTTDSEDPTLVATLEHQGRVIVPCNPRRSGWFRDAKFDRQSTIESCKEQKEFLEQMNGVKYRFGKAVAYDIHNHNFYFELIEE